MVIQQKVLNQLTILQGVFHDITTYLNNFLLTIDEGRKNAVVVTTVTVKIYFNF